VRRRADFTIAVPISIATASREVRFGMTRLRPLLVVVLMLGTISAASVAGAQAAQPAAVSITSHTVRGCPEPDSCTFVASGAIADSGTVTTVLVHAAAASSPVTGTAQYERTFHGEAGTFTIRLQTRLSGTDDPSLFQEEGEWTVIDGAGDYTGLRGQGHESGIRDFQHQSLDVEYTGTVQLP
jgi:hypothetical protein